MKNYFLDLVNVCVVVSGSICEGSDNLIELPKVFASYFSHKMKGADTYSITESAKNTIMRFIEETKETEEMLSEILESLKATKASFKKEMDSLSEELEKEQFAEYSQIVETVEEVQNETPLNCYVLYMLKHNSATPEKVLLWYTSNNLPKIKAKGKTRFVKLSEKRKQKCLNLEAIEKAINEERLRNERAETLGRLFAENPELQKLVEESAKKCGYDIDFMVA